VRDEYSVQNLVQAFKMLVCSDKVAPDISMHDLVQVATKHLKRSRLHY